MDFKLLHSEINMAKQHESETNELKIFLEKRSFDLHRMIVVPQYQASSHLFAFVIRYIEQIPDLLKATQKISEQTGIGLLTQSALDTALEFLLQPLDDSDTTPGMLTFMTKAYVSYRIVEEIDNRFMASCNEPMLPTDLSKSNIIIHHLIGDDIATDLDLTIHVLAEQLEIELSQLDTQLPRFDRERHHKLLSQIKHWPIFNNVTLIDIVLTKPQHMGTTH
jgi:hypothetical protein